MIREAATCSNRDALPELLYVRLSGVEKGVSEGVSRVCTCIVKVLCYSGG